MKNTKPFKQKNNFLLTFILLSVFIVRLNSQTLTLDASFNLSPTYSTGINYHLLQPDGKIILTGGFHVLTNSPRTQVARLLPNGTTDNSFNADTVLKAPVYCAQLQTDGKLLVGGVFNSNFLQGPRNYLARLNANGSLDTSFQTLDGFDNIVYGLTLQPDGKMIAIGYFFNYNSYSCPRIARINSDGSFDTSFDPGMSFNDYVNHIALQADGKIVAGGAFVTYNGLSANKIARLIDGALDGSFNVGAGFSGPGICRVNKILIQPDGKIIAAGSFTNYQGSACNNIVRINSNGTIDATFNTGTGLDSTANDMAYQADGKIIVSGCFSGFNGNVANKMVRLNADGSFDSSFSVGSGFDNNIVHLLLQPDGKLICSGEQLQYNGMPCNHVLRLNNSVSTSLEINRIDQELFIYPNPFKGSFTLKFSTGQINRSLKVKIYNSLGDLVKVNAFYSNNDVTIDMAGIERGLYMLCVYDDGNCIVKKKLIKQD